MIRQMWAAVRSGALPLERLGEGEHLGRDLGRQRPRLGLERLEPAGPPRPDPLIGRRTPHPHRGPVGAGCVVRRDLADQARPAGGSTTPGRPPPGSTRSGTRPPRWLGLSSSCSLLRRSIAHRSERPTRVAAPHGASQGEFVLDNNRPTVSAAAHDHGGRDPSRNDAARAAPRSPPPRRPAPRRPGRRAQHRVQPMRPRREMRRRTGRGRDEPAQPAPHRRSRPTQLAQRPCAAPRPPPPPSTPSPSPRPCPHGAPKPHRATTPASTRTNGTGPAEAATPPAVLAAQHPRPANPTGATPRRNPDTPRPGARSISTTTGSLPTMSTMPSGITERTPSYSAKRSARGSLREQDILTLSPTQRHRKHQPARPPSCPSTSPIGCHVLDGCVAQHPHGGRALARVKR